MIYSLDFKWQWNPFFLSFRNLFRKFNWNFIRNLNFELEIIFFQVFFTYIEQWFLAYEKNTMK